MNFLWLTVLLLLNFKSRFGPANRKQTEKSCPNPAQHWEKTDIIDNYNGRRRLILRNLQKRITFPENPAYSLARY